MLVVLVAVGLIAGLIEGTKALREQIHQQNAEAAALAQKTVYPAPSNCKLENLDVKATMPDTVSAGAGLTVSLELRNRGSEACLLDTSKASLNMLVTTGGQTVWDSKTCPAGDPGGVLLLPGTDTAKVDPGASKTPAAAGLAADTTVSMKWDGKTAASDCAADKATVSTAGTYHLSMSLDGADLLGDKVFVVR
ncbi:Uncharacterised protein [Actinomyces bovis]|uniref:DUF4232 domain-containing protein n=1 Tax=Actinomyces bovis TaxID=1658 RepID=A0ABY1VM40_9ACTO|nr:Uncharacterised protein [Actinomyces bovis]VEG55218.1 Uncharacterised protein [Actinomyces israelii]